MTPPLSEEALEALWRQATTPDHVSGLIVGVQVVSTTDLISLISEVRHLRSERSGYRQGLEDAADTCETASVPIPIGEWYGTKKQVSAATTKGLARLLRERIARLSVDAEQESEHISQAGDKGD